MRLGYRGYFSAVLMIVGLSGCGKAEFGETLGGPAPGEGPSSPPATINLILSSAALPATANLPGDENAVEITAVVTDAANNAVSNATVVFGASSGVLTVDQATTDGSGIATAHLGTGGDPTLRDITITAATGGVTRTAVVHVLSSIVTGPQAASITLLPPTGSTLPSDADTVEEGLQLTAVARDAQNAGLEGVEVQFAASSGLLQNITATTNENGLATAVLTTGGDPTLRAITVSALGGGRSATNTYQVVNPQTGFGVAQLRLVASRPILAPTDSTADNGITLTAFATDSHGNAVAGAPVQFNADSGQLVDVATVTDENGRATAVLTTGGDPTDRTINVSATIGSLTATLVPPIIVSESTIGFFSVTLSASSNRLAPDASSTEDGVLLTATVKDENGAPVINTQAAFCNGEETIALATTNSQGVATTILTTAGDPTPRDIVLRATAAPGGLSEADLPCTNVVFADDQAFSNPITITVRSVANAATVNVVSDTNILSPEAATLDRAATITAIVLDANGVALVGVPVTFGTTTGALLQAQARTDENGVATVKLTTGGNSTPRTAVVSATADGVTGQTSVQIRRASTLDLTVLPSSLPADADTLAEAATVTATLLDEQGQPIAGVPVTFEAEGGDLQTTRGVTDAAGTATASLTTGGNSLPRNITVTASATLGEISLTRNITVPVVQQVATVTLIAASPQLLSADSNAAQGDKLTAVVTDSNGNLLKGVTVTFTTSTGALQVTQAVTDAAGVATAVLTTGGVPFNRTATVRASAGGVDSNVLTIDIIGTTLTISGPAVVGSGSTATFTVILADSSGTGIPNTTVNLSSALHNPIAPTALVTDSLGQGTFNYTGTTGGLDTITGSAQGVTGSTTVAVATSSLVFTSPPAGTQVNFGDVQTLKVHFTENGSAVSGATVDFTTTRGTLSSSQAVTDANGDATVDIQSSGANGAGGAFITAQVTCIPPHVCPPDHDAGPSATLTIVFIATPPASVLMQSSPSTIGLGGSSTVTATLRDASGNLVANQQVDFTLTDVTGGSLSASTAITNESGVASVTYTASQTSSGTKGVRIDATVHNFPSITTTGFPNTPSPAPAFITVSKTALEVHIGQNNKVGTDPNDPAAYQFPMDVIVQDSAGNPAPANTIVNLRVISVKYFKGHYNTGTSPYTVVYTVPGGCPSEDADNDGILDANEDNNNNGKLDPGNVATVPATVSLTSNGVGPFILEYPKSFANWVQVDVQATATVAGSEGSADAILILPVAVADVTPPESPPGGLTSPFGNGASCGDTL